MRRVSYYPGCTQEGSGKPLDVTVKMVLSHLGVDMVEVPDWNCCGATSAHVRNELLSHVLPARNLALSEKVSEILITPCAACYARLFTTNEEMRKGKELFSQVNSILFPLSYGGGVEVMNIVEFLWKEVGLPKISSKVKSTFTGKRLLAYYGCLLTRTPGLTPYDDQENPRSMEEIIEVTGAQSPDWPYKTRCCGGSLALIKEDVGIELVRAIVAYASRVEADAIVTACPLCQVNLDFFQIKGGLKKRIPVVYITEILARSFDLKIPGRYISSHFVSVDPLFGG